MPFRNLVSGGGGGTGGVMFGQFDIDPDSGELYLNYVGEASENSFSINDNGELEVEV